VVHICEYDPAKVSTVEKDLESVGRGNYSSWEERQLIYVQNLHAWMVGRKTATTFYITEEI
jgi:hypothetical protein